MDNSRFPQNSSNGAYPNAYGGAYGNAYNPNNTVLSATPALSEAAGVPVQPTPPPVQMTGSEFEGTRSQKTASLIKTIILVVLGLITVTFIGLFIWMFLQYDKIRTDVEGQISMAVAEARKEQSEQDEAEFLVREKYPYRSFVGPSDYGELSFEYPKTWSVFIAADAANGGNFEAYFNPIEVNPISDATINALRLSILNSPYETVVASYETALKQRENPLTVEAITLPNGITANRYTGTIPGTQLYGYIVVFKIRDKTAVFRTDSVNFTDDFNTLLNTIKFNL